MDICRSSSITFFFSLSKRSTLKFHNLTHKACNFRLNRKTIKTNTISYFMYWWISGYVFSYDLLMHHWRLGLGVELHVYFFLKIIFVQLTLYGSIPKLKIEMFQLNLSQCQRSLSLMPTTLLINKWLLNASLWTPPLRMRSNFFDMMTWNMSIKRDNHIAKA